MRPRMTNPQGRRETALGIDRVRRTIARGIRVRPGFRPDRCSIGVGADDFSAVTAAQGRIGDRADAGLEEVDRAVGEQEVGSPRGAWLLNPLDAAPNRQPSTPFDHPLRQVGSAAGTVFEFQLIGMVVPAVPPFSFQKLLSVVWTGRTSPTMIVLLVPSVTLAIFTT